ncbi:unnamed protein product [Urochloa humidicola]
MFGRSISIDLSGAPEQHGPDPTFQAASRTLRNVQVRRRNGEQKEQDSSHEQDEVEQDMVAVGGEVGHGGGEKAGDSPRRHGGRGAEAWIVELREGEAEHRLPRLAGAAEGALVVGDGSVVLHRCDLGDRFPQGEA